MKNEKMMIKESSTKYISPGKNLVIPGKKRKGFTLVEMIIVVTILGILASIALVKYGKAEMTAKKNVDYTNAANIATAAIMASIDGKETDNISVESLIEGGYLNSEPKPQSVGGEFEISFDKERRGVIVEASDQIFYPKDNEVQE